MVITSVKEALEAVKKDPLSLQFIPEEFQTDEVCMISMFNISLNKNYIK
jgi:hypothetical protein